MFQIMPHDLAGSSISGLPSQDSHWSDLFAQAMQASAEPGGTGSAPAAAKVAFSEAQPTAARGPGSVREAAEEMIRLDRSIGATRERLLRGGEFERLAAKHGVNLSSGDLGLMSQDRRGARLVEGASEGEPAGGAGLYSTSGPIGAAASPVAPSTGSYAQPSLSPRSSYTIGPTRGREMGIEQAARARIADNERKTEFVTRLTNARMEQMMQMAEFKRQLEARNQLFTISIEMKNLAQQIWSKLTSNG
jgi:hypothetical protein